MYCRFGGQTNFLQFKIHVAFDFRPEQITIAVDEDDVLIVLLS